MNTVLVTGGNGYIGSYLVDSLSASGFGVLKTSRRGGAGDVRVMDLLDDSSIEGVCGDVDAVVHTANYDERLIPGNGRDALLANSYATRQLYLDAVKNGVSRFIYFSTFHVYGKSAGTITEKTETAPVSDYAMTHLFAERYLSQLARKCGVPVDVVRLTNGIGMPPKGCDKWYLVVNDCCKSAVEKQAITLRSSGTQPRDFVAITDVCSAVRLLLSQPPGEPFTVFNVSSEAGVTIREIAEMTAAAYEAATGNRVALSIPDARPDEKTEDLLVCSEKIRGLGWTPRLRTGDVIAEIIRELLRAEV